MSEQFYVTQIVVQKGSPYAQVPSDTFTTVNPNGSNPPPQFDTYKEAEEWIKNNGIKCKWYQIQKYLMPV